MFQVFFDCSYLKIYHFYVFQNFYCFLMIVEVPDLKKGAYFIQLDHHVFNLLSRYSLLLCKLYLNYLKGLNCIVRNSCISVLSFKSNLVCFFNYYQNLNLKNLF